MIRRAFRPAISGLILLGWLGIHSMAVASPRVVSCHDDYTAESFEAAGEELGSFIDEYFTDVNISFPPQKNQFKALHLVQQGEGIYLRPDATRQAGGKRRYPVRPGIWKVIDFGAGVWEIHVLVREPQKLSETEAFNTDNDLLGEPFADYDNAAYGMTLQPEDIRRRYRNRFFTLNARVYGVRGDATQLDRTLTDVVLTDYTDWVKRNRWCQHHRRPVLPMHRPLP